MEDITLRMLSRRIEQLRSDLIKLQTNISTIESNLSSITHSDIAYSTDIERQCDQYLQQCTQLCESIRDENIQGVQSSIDAMNLIKKQMSDEIADIDKLFSQKNIIMYDTIQSLIRRLDRVHIDIINNDDNIQITYTDHNGKSECGTILKVRSDEKTLTQDHEGVISLKYKFDDKSFIIKDDIIYPTQLRTSDGLYVSSEYIINNLKNATYNVSSITRDIKHLQQQLSTSNGYMSSNDFKVGVIEQDKLTQFAIDCLSTPGSKITVDQIPSGTKIKNTFDNHIWVFNRIHNSGLTTYKWEDFGSDSICVANNDGVHGLVTGSNDTFKGHVDINGVISINGLEEQLESVMMSLTSAAQLIQEQDDRLKKVEQMLGLH